MTVERDTATVVIKQVPSNVCQNCGEAYVDAEIAARVLAIVDEANMSGVHVEIRDYRAA